MSIFKYFMNKLYILLFALMFLTIPMNARELSVTASVDSTQIWIGQQTKVHYEFTQHKGEVVLLPVFSDTLTKNLELVEPFALDTFPADQEMLKVGLHLLVTSFEDTLIYIAPQAFVLDGDTSWSNSISLKVIQPFEIDTASATIADIKDVMNPPFNWNTLFKWLLWTLLGLVLITALYFIVRKFIKSKNKTEEIAIEDSLPAFQVALLKLNKVKESKIWLQENRSKEYHTEVTDILREYIEHIFEIPAPEMTSEEIIEHLKDLRIKQKETWNGLRQIFQLADLVKFAKWRAMPEEQELSLKNAYKFVEDTKIEEIVENTNTDVVS